MEHFETRAVLAGAYAKPEGHALLTHAALVADGTLIGVLCRRVKPEHLADVNASDPGAPPSCLRCRAALVRRKGNP